MLGFNIRESPSVESVRIDFHTHTLASDGALSPAELMARAAARAVTHFAITDHDTLAGYVAASEHIPPGLDLVSGVELSCTWGKTTIHVVGLGFDPDAAAMREAMEHLSEARRARAQQIADRLEIRGYSGALAGAQAVAGNSQIGRPHFAEWLVSAGHFSDVRSVFDKLLGQGKIGDVKTYWPALADSVATVSAAGGIAVLAHPLHYKLTRTKLHALCRDFAAAGGRALEVMNGRQSAADTQQLRRLAETYDFAASGGSDFHRDGPYAAEPGIESDFATGLTPVWQLLP